MKIVKNLFVLFGFASLFFSCATSKSLKKSHKNIKFEDLKKIEFEKIEKDEEFKFENENLNVQAKKCSRNLVDLGIKNANSLAAFFLSENPNFDKNHIKDFAQIYIDECKIEEINSDCAFVQMCLETGFLRFGGLVEAGMHNYCGLGAIDAQNRGEAFASEKDGVRAHIQHLHAYATTADKTLKNSLIDRRYKYVFPRGKAKTIFELSGTWAADKLYGQKLDALLSRLEEF